MVRGGYLAFVSAQLSSKENRSKVGRPNQLNAEHERTKKKRGLLMGIKMSIAISNKESTLIKCSQHTIVKVCNGESRGRLHLSHCFDQNRSEYIFLIKIILKERINDVQTDKKAHKREASHRN